MKDIHKTIENLVYSFFTEMNKWEKFCYEVDNNKNILYEDKRTEQKKEAERIVNRFLTNKERKMGLPNYISYGHEGSYKYNPEEEKIISIEVEKNKVIVTTFREKPIEDYNKYVLKRVKENWLIDSKKNYSWKEKWENAIL